MSEQANVKSVDALQQLLERLLQARVEIQQVLAQMEQQNARVRGWFEQDARVMWRERQRRSSQALAEARVSLDAARMRGSVAGNVPTCYDERKAMERAKQRLRHSEEQEERVRQWGTRLAGEIEEHHGRTNGLRLYLESDFERTVALLERTIDVLRQYSEDAPPGD